MTPPPAALALPLGLVLGAALGFGLALATGGAGGAGSALPAGMPRAVDAAERPGVGHDGTATRPPGLRARGGLERSDAGRSRGPALDPASLDTGALTAAGVEEALGEAVRGDTLADAGEGELTGTAWDEYGRPLAGVLVVAARSAVPDPYGRTADDLAPATPASLRGVLTERARELAERQVRERRTVTGEDGGFRFEDLPAGTYRIRGYAEGYLFEAEPDGEVRPGRAVALLGERVRELEVDVVLPDGSRPEVARIEARGAAGGRTLRWTPDAPRLRLPPGDSMLTAKAGIDVLASGAAGPAAYESEPTPAERGVEEVVLHLQEQQGLWGEVVDEWDGSSRDLEVRAVPGGADDGAFLEALEEPAARSRLRSGIYHLEDLAPGTYGIALVPRRGGEPYAKGTVVVDQGLVREDLRVAGPDPAEAIRVRCTAPDGRVLRGIRFRCEIKSPTSRRASSSGTPRLHCDAEAVYWLEPRSLVRGEDYDALPEGMAVALTATHEQFGSETVELRSGQRRVDIAFAPPGSVEVRIVGYATSPLKDRLSVRLLRTVEVGGATRTVRAPRSAATSRLTPEGVIAWTGLTPGVWTVKLELSNPNQGWRPRQEVESLDVEVPAGGSRSVTLGIPTLHTVVLRVPNLGERAYVSLTPKPEDGSGIDLQNPWGNAGTRSAWVDEGQVVFDGLEPGDYLLTANGSSDRLEIRVPGGPYVFEATRHDCFRVAISDPEGPLARAGLQAGDRVVAVEGREFTVEDRNEIWQLARGRVELTVLRRVDGRDRRITIPPGDEPWLGPGESVLGGTFTPASRGR